MMFVRGSPLFAPTVCRMTRGAPSNWPPTRPWFARNSAMLCSLKSLAMAASLPAGAQPRDDIAKADRQRAVELRVGARRRLAVRAPAVELRGVAEPLALHVVVTHLDDPLGPQRHERQVLAVVPSRVLVLARRPLACLVGGPVPRVAIEIRYQRLKFGEQLAALRHRERTDHAHGRQRAAVLVEPE